MLIKIKWWLWWEERRKWTKWSWERLMMFWLHSSRWLWWSDCYICISSDHEMILPSVESRIRESHSRHSLIIVRQIDFLFLSLKIILLVFVSWCSAITENVSCCITSSPSDSVAKGRSFIFWPQKVISRYNNSSHKEKLQSIVVKKPLNKILILNYFSDGIIIINGIRTQGSTDQQNE